MTVPDPSGRPRVEHPRSEWRGGEHSDRHTQLRIIVVFALIFLVLAAVAVGIALLKAPPAIKPPCSTPGCAAPPRAPSPGGVGTTGAIAPSTGQALSAGAALAGSGLGLSGSGASGSVRLAGSGKSGSGSGGSGSGSGGSGSSGSSSGSPAAAQAAPAYSAGAQTYTSPGLGFSFEYPQGLTVNQSSGNQVVLVNGSQPDLIVYVIGAPVSQASPQDVRNVILHDLGQQIPNLASVSASSPMAIPAAELGGHQGVGGFYQGYIDSPNGPQTPVDLAVLAASDGRQSLAVAVESLNQQATDGRMRVIDHTMLDSFRFQGDTVR